MSIKITPDITEPGHYSVRLDLPTATPRDLAELHEWLGEHLYLATAHALEQALLAEGYDLAEDPYA